MSGRGGAVARVLERAVRRGGQRRRRHRPAQPAAISRRRRERGRLLRHRGRQEIRRRRAVMRHPVVRQAQPREPQPMVADDHGPGEAGDHARRASGTPQRPGSVGDARGGAGCDAGAGGVVPRDQTRRGPGRWRAVSPAAPVPAAAPDPDGGRRDCPADRLRQHRRADARESDDPYQGNGGEDGARRFPPAADSPVTHRISPPRLARRRRRRVRGEVGRRASRAESRHRSQPSLR